MDGMGGNYIYLYLTRDGTNSFAVLTIVLVQNSSFSDAAVVFDPYKLYTYVFIFFFVREAHPNCSSNR